MGYVNYKEEGGGGGGTTTLVGQLIYLVPGILIPSVVVLSLIMFVVLRRRHNKKRVGGGLLVAGWVGVMARGEEVVLWEYCAGWGGAIKCDVVRHCTLREWGKGTGGAKVQVRQRYRWG